MPGLGGPVSLCCALGGKAPPSGYFCTPAGPPRPRASCPPAACPGAASVTGTMAAMHRRPPRCPSTQVRPVPSCPQITGPVCVQLQLKASQTVCPSLPPSPGPRLYKEPSAKSNKFIIHNALSHCCLAGKVNEPHKNRILEVSLAEPSQGEPGGRGLPGGAWPCGGGGASDLIGRAWFRVGGAS